eukprot:CAMPEP_0194485632 /NCGR_PEP_ID=MMETSP0253-20130528/6570_1 /TAXON_ID=2966 /ORGANISM="Noctiluca scintillans" /LENGTH=110 /DNA_ID=CAMNT_0039325631 /DNA_START=185 /DNA_END=513 /DNA_ORIENTATION=+
MRTPSHEPLSKVPPLNSKMWFPEVLEIFAVKASPAQYVEPQLTVLPSLSKCTVRQEVATAVWDMMAVPAVKDLVHEKNEGCAPIQLTSTPHKTHWSASGDQLDCKFMARA